MRARSPECEEIYKRDDGGGEDGSVTLSKIQ